MSIRRISKETLIAYLREISTDLTLPEVSLPRNAAVLSIRSELEDASVDDLMTVFVSQRALLEKHGFLFEMYSSWNE